VNSGGESGQQIRVKSGFPRASVSPHLSSPSSTPSQTPPPQHVPCADPVQTGFPGKSDDVIWPERRTLPQLPDGEITQEIGEAFCKKICAVYPEVFDGGKGKFLGAEATMLLKPGGLDKIKRTGFRPAAKVPYGLEDQYSVHLDALYEDLTIIDGKDLITASQIVPVIETINGVRKLKRLAINYKSTVNEHLLDIPDVFTTCTEELNKLAGEFRSCVDLKGAYKQVVLTDEFSRKILAVVTPRGYAIPNRLMFGVKTAPAIFNANMRKLIHSCNGRGPIKAAQMVDDVCLTGKSPSEHFDNLAEFIYRLYACGLKANLAKCSFYKDEVKFLGKVVDRNGVRLDTSTTAAILNMPVPTDISRLRSFLGLISYVSKHCPDLRSARAPLDYLCKPDVKFLWDTDHDSAFQRCKMLAGNSALLTHFDPAKPLVLTTDASP
ncbi:MAG: RNA-directed DNA polymerase, partial [Aestuariibacter sp.]|nr:RNA-directed DNA polymerase [Aestuariibacter sp.]